MSLHAATPRQTDRHPGAPLPGKERPTEAELPTFRLHMMRGGYLLMAVGLVIVKWPLLLQAASLPLMDGVVLCLLTAMSLLALLGLRYPIKMLPILLFEVIWKVLWLGLVALPHLIANDMNKATSDMLFSILFVSAILVVTPWDYVWKHYVKAHGDSWGRTALRRGSSHSPR
ncbi:hypothetical protein RCH21_000012 [Arthrobacter sp. PL16]|uniref:hypothetical protein n=1 Tax=Arthrobacter sp. PL16 TaxID=3071720 RepID=UPI002DF937E3|nr:hypothetical protein [Arthrobacter sp. PL16]